MVETFTPKVEENREAFVAELTEAALVVAVKDGTYGRSVEIEIDLAHALGTALRDRGHRIGLHRADHGWEERLAELTDAAYQVLLHHRFRHNFIEVQLDLRKAFRYVIRRNRFLPARSSSGGDSTRLSGLLAIH
jgi:hypothetical protein